MLSLGGLLLIGILTGGCAKSFGRGPTEWRPVASLPTTLAQCGLEWATVPPTALPWGWAPCVDGVCEVLTLPADGAVFRSPGVVVGGRAYVAFTVRADAAFLGGPPSHDFLVLLREDGPRSVWRRRLGPAGDGGCIAGAGTTALGQGSFAIGVVAWTDGLEPPADAPLTLFVDRVDADWREPQGAPVAASSLGQPERLTLSDEILLAEGEELRLIDLADGEAAPRERLAPSAVVAERLAWGPDAVWLEVGVDLPRYARGGLDAPTELFLAPPDADVGGLATDGESWVWWQGYGARCPIPLSCAPYERVELWTAPFTMDPEALAPRRVGAIRAPFLVARVGAGRAAFSQVLPGSLPGDGTAPRELWTMDLETGEARAQPTPAGFSRAFPWALTRDELYFRARADDGEHLMRVRLRDLAAASP
ncbi:MAG: hypothetical protein ACFCGT_08925 [Sandaracinaceae bacterium]